MTEKEAKFLLGWEVPIPRAYRARLRAMLRYMVAHWPPSLPVKLRFTKLPAREEAIALCSPRAITQRKAGLLIEIDSRACYYHAIDLLIHEYAHAVAWDIDPTDHGAAWAGVHLDIVRAFEDGDAFEESKTW